MRRAYKYDEGDYNAYPSKKRKFYNTFGDQEADESKAWKKMEKELATGMLVDTDGKTRDCKLTKNCPPGYWYKRPLNKIPLEYVPQELRYPVCEIKSADTPVGGLNIGTNNIVNDIVALTSNIVQGFEINNRIGRKINIVSIEARLGFNMLNTPTTVLAPKPIRWLLVWDGQNNNVAVTAASTFLTTSGASPPYQMYNPDNRQRFIVLYDSGAFFLGPYGNSFSWASSLQEECYCECNLPLIWSAGTTTTITGQLYAIFLADDTMANTQTSVTGVLRVSWIDP